MSDLISRQAAIDVIKDADICVCYSENESVEIEDVIDLAIRATKGSVIASIEQMPSAEPTLYEYNINHLAFIAGIMAKKGITAEEAIEIFKDAERLFKLISDDMQEPAADAVPVVRCRDCKYNRNPPSAGNALCDNFYGMTDQNGFCHFGERRTDGLTVSPPPTRNSRRSGSGLKIATSTLARFAELVLQPLLKK